MKSKKFPCLLLVLVALLFPVTLASIVVIARIVEVNRREAQEAEDRRELARQVGRFAKALQGATPPPTK